MFTERNKARHCYASSSNDAPQGCKPALGQERGISFAHRLAAKSARCPFPVAKHCCKWFLLTCRIYVSSLMLLNCACELLPRELKVLPGTFIFPVEGCKQENSQLAASKDSPKTRKEEAARDPVEGCKQKTNSQPQRLGDTARQAGDTTPEPASQKRAPQRLGDTGTSGRHDPGAGVTASGRQEDKQKTGPRNRRHTFPFSIPQVRTPMLRCLGKNNSNTNNSNDNNNNNNNDNKNH